MSPVSSLPWNPEQWQKLSLPRAESKGQRGSGGLTLRLRPPYWGALLESLCKEDLVGVGWGLGAGCPQALEQNHKASLGSGFVFIGV